MSFCVICYINLYVYPHTHRPIYYIYVRICRYVYIYVRHTRTHTNDVYVCSCLINRCIFIPIMYIHRIYIIRIFKKYRLLEYLVTRTYKNYIFLTYSIIFSSNFILQKDLEIKNFLYIYISISVSCQTKREFYHLRLYSFGLLYICFVLKFKT